MAGVNPVTYVFIYNIDYIDSHTIYTMHNVVYDIVYIYLIIVI